MEKNNDLNEAHGDEMDCKKEREDELEIEAYSPHELKSKKRGISTRVAIAGVVVVVAIGITGLMVNFIYPDALHNVIDAKRITTDPYYNVVGGSGSWFLSRMERFDG
ncbi:MAG: hypothetical protein LBC96_09805 [Lachnospiraceae bacterium]|jgi:hypothetical protein|nr:hypothetical protein [Lachnospiraceae bacterium]